MKTYGTRDLVTGEYFEIPWDKTVCYLANNAGQIERIICDSNAKAFEITVKRNTKPQRLDIEWRFENWRAYDANGQIIVGLAICR